MGKWPQKGSKRGSQNDPLFDQKRGPKMVQKVVKKGVWDPLFSRNTSEMGYFDTFGPSWVQTGQNRSEGPKPLKTAQKGSNSSYYTVGAESELPMTGPDRSGPAEPQYASSAGMNLAPLGGLGRFGPSGPGPAQTPQNTHFWTIFGPPF